MEPWIALALFVATYGRPIAFGRFLRVGGLVALMSIAISSVYLWLRYLL